MRTRSLAGRKSGEKRRWAAWYRDKRKLSWVTVDELLEAALREQGSHPLVTKTKLRKAAERLLREAGAAAQSTNRAG